MGGGGGAADADDPDAMLRRLFAKIAGASRRGHLLQLHGGRDGRRAAAGVVRSASRSKRQPAPLTRLEFGQADLRHRGLAPPAHRRDLHPAVRRPEGAAGQVVRHPGLCLQPADGRRQAARHAVLRQPVEG